MSPSIYLVLRISTIGKQPGSKTQDAKRKAKDDPYKNLVDMYDHKGSNLREGIHAILGTCTTNLIQHPNPMYTSKITYLDPMTVNRSPMNVGKDDNGNWF